MPYTSPNLWTPQGVDYLEANADTVVQSSTSFSVIAGPGAGKTELLAQRACYLLQTGRCPNPYRILAISFKKDAAKNLYERIKQRCPEEANRFDSLTFDAFSKSLLDRFLNALPEVWRPKRRYEIFFPESRNYEIFGNFLIDFATNAERRRVLNISSEVFAKKYILGSPLPYSIDSEVYNIEQLAVREWWRSCLHVGDTSRLSFPMIGRLAELVIRTNPFICNALRVTYTHVFLDEFQDTTNIQYDLLKTAFMGSKSILTAVGDNKQHIMRWAGALEDAFTCFDTDFAAKRIYLLHNYRSSEALVKIQHAIALEIDPNSKLAISKSSSCLRDDFCTVWDFDNCDVEKYMLAKFVARAIKSENRSPRDFLFIVKQRPDQYASELLPIFSRFGIKLRSEAELQDILSENVTRLLLTFLRFGAHSRAGKYWALTLELLSKLWCIDFENEKAAYSLQDQLSEFHLKLHEAMLNTKQSPETIGDCLKKIIHFVGVKQIQALYPEYSCIDFLKKTAKQVLNQLLKSFNNCQPEYQWDAVLNDFEGLDSVPLMTIHKSKGLEYATVIFLGLDDKAWWSFDRQPEETKCAFFVALSRAKEQVVFSYCEERGERQKINSFYKLLQDAGVNTQTFKGITLSYLSKTS